MPSKLYGILAAGRPVLFIGDPDGEVARVIGPAGAGLGVAIGERRGACAAYRGAQIRPRIAARLGRERRCGFTASATPSSARWLWMALLRGAGRRAASSYRKPLLPAPSLCHFQIDEHFVGRAHPAEIEAGAAVQDAQAHDVEVEEDDLRPQRHVVQELLQGAPAVDGIAAEQRRAARCGCDADSASRPPPWSSSGCAARTSRRPRD